MNGYRITYRTLDGAAPEDEASTLANIYSSLIINRRQKAAVGCGGSNDAERKVRDEESGTRRTLPKGD